MITFEMAGEPVDHGRFLDWLQERDQRIAECGGRESGHAWQVQGDVGEQPWLSCEDCPASADDLMPDLLTYLYDTTSRIGTHEVPWGRELAEDAEPYTIPVNVHIETITHACLDWVGNEYDYEIQITPRGGEPE